MPKVTLDPDIYMALKAESLVRNNSLKDTLASLVINNLSPKAQSVLNALEVKRALLPHELQLMMPILMRKYHPERKKHDSLL